MTDNTQATADTSPIGMLRHRQFARFIAATSVASTGQFLSGLATPFLVNELTDSNTWVGAVGFAGLVPAIFATPIGGIMSDRYRRQRLLAICYSLLAVTSAFFLALHLAGALTPTRILLISLGFGTISGFMWASVQAMTPILVPPSDLVPSVQLVSISFTVGRAAGPLLAALVLWRSGPGLAFAITCGSYVVAATILWLLRTGPQPEPSARSPIQDYRDGLRYIAERPGIRLAIRATFVVACLGSVWIFSLATSVADDVFGVGGGGLGLLVTMVGLGSVLASIVVSRHGRSVERSRFETAALTLYATGVLIAMATPWLIVGLAGYLMMGFAHMWHTVTLTTAVQVQVDETHRGRVMSVWILAIFVGLPIGAIAGGLLADLADIRVVMAAAGTTLLLFTGWSWVRHDRFRLLDMVGGPSEQTA